MDPVAYSQLYPPEPPAKLAANEDENRRLDREDGVLILRDCASEDLVPCRRPGEKHAKYLWVIVPDEVPFVLETAPSVRPPPLSLGVAKHSNLTGGEPASCGGELWVDPVENRKLFANGGSGRYPAKTPQQMEDAIRVLAACGFTVVSAGWS